MKCLLILVLGTDAHGGPQVKDWIAGTALLLVLGVLLVVFLIKRIGGRRK